MSRIQRSAVIAVIVLLFVSLGVFRVVSHLAASDQTTAGGGLITESSIRAHMEFLASDALNGRGSGTRDEWIAATYIASQFRRWGLEPFGDDGGYVQQIEMAGAEATAPPTLTAGALTLTHGKEMIVATIAGAARRWAANQVSGRSARARRARSSWFRRASA